MNRWNKVVWTIFYFCDFQREKACWNCRASKNMTVRLSLSSWRKTRQAICSSRSSHYCLIRQTALWNSLFCSRAPRPISEPRNVWSLHAPWQGEVKSPDLWWWLGWQMSCQLCNGFVLMTEWVTARVHAGSLLNTYWITVTQSSCFSDAIYCNNFWSVCHST